MKDIRARKDSILRSPQDDGPELLGDGSYSSAMILGSRRIEPDRPATIVIGKYLAPGQTEDLTASPSREVPELEHILRPRLELSMDGNIIIVFKKSLAWLRLPEPRRKRRALGKEP